MSFHTCKMPRRGQHLAEALPHRNARSSAKQFTVNHVSTKEIMINKKSGKNPVIWRYRSTMPTRFFSILRYQSTDILIVSIHVFPLRSKYVTIIAVGDPGRSDIRFLIPIEKVLYNSLNRSPWPFTFTHWIFTVDLYLLDLFVKGIETLNIHSKLH